MATALDGYSGMFPVTSGVVESENANSWHWFLEGLKQAIRMPEGLVLASDRQKGLEEATPKVYPMVEHRRCMRHQAISWRLFEKALWTAARSFTTRGYLSSLEEIKKASPDAYAYVTDPEAGLWRRSSFGTTSKCHYNANNLSRIS